MRKLMKIEISESDNTLLATDQEGHTYPVSLAVMKSIARRKKKALVKVVAAHLDFWGCSDSFKELHPADDWKTIYEADK